MFGKSVVQIVMLLISILFLTCSTPVNLAKLPPRIEFDSINFTGYVGEEFAPITPKLLTGGDLDSFTVTPSLPSGMLFDVKTGTISGTPLHHLNRTPVTIKAYNMYGIGEQLIYLTVIPLPPSNIVATIDTATKTVNVRWTTPPGVTLVRIYKGISGDGPFALVETRSDSTWSDKSITASELFYYCVSVFGNDGLSRNSPVIAVRTSAQNKSPIPAPDTYSISEDTPLFRTAGEGVLSNDSDPNGDQLFAALQDSASNGTLKLLSDGSFTYEPKENFNGTDSFSYRVKDSQNSTAENVKVTLSVTAANDKPDAIDDTYSLLKNSTLVIDSATGVLANDKDIDGDLIRAVLKTAPKSGTLTLQENGSFTYKPNANFEGKDSVVYYAKDKETSDSATVTFTVSSTPSSTKSLTSFGFLNPVVSGTIDTIAKTIALKVPFGTNVTALTATFTSTGAMVKIGSVVQASGTTVNNFTTSVTYTIIAADNSTQDYVVTVTVMPYVFTVTFDDQGATTVPNPSTKTITAPATTVGTLPVDPQRTNFAFGGWFTGKNGTGTSFTESTPVSQNLTVYAKWIPVYRVFYNANGGSGSVPVDSNFYQSEHSATVLSGNTLTKINFTFSGWNTEMDTTGATYLSGTTLPIGSATITLYAKWRMSAPTITTHPTNQSCPVNALDTFTVTATGLNLSYQWQKNGVNIPGAISASYTPAALTVDDTSGAASYRCIISNISGSVTSNSAMHSISTLTDIENNIYHLVKIGTQIWTMDNLRVTKYNDNTPIPNITTTAEWSEATTPMYCFYNNTTNSDTIRRFGAFYNWYVVNPLNTKKIAPHGWHVPSDNEWTILVNYLISNGYNWDGSKIENKIAKSMATKSDWVTTQTVGTAGNNLPTNNSCGFSAYPFGFISYNGTFGNLGYNCSFWSATVGDVDYVFSAFNWSIGYLGESSSRSEGHKSSGLNVRLVKDNH